MIFPGEAGADEFLTSGISKRPLAFIHKAIKLSSDPAFNAVAYQTLLARLYLELDDPQKALHAWQSGQSLDGEKDRLAEVLRVYASATAAACLMRNFRRFWREKRQTDAPHESEHVHHHKDDEVHDACELCHDQMQETPPLRQHNRPLNIGVSHDPVTACPKDQGSRLRIL